MEVIGGGRELEGGGVVAFDGDHWLLAVQLIRSGLEVGETVLGFGFSNMETSDLSDLFSQG